MIDLIDRQAAIDALKDMYHVAEKWGKEATDDVIKARAESCMASLIEMKLRIEKLPSAQPEIIRCKDCLFSTCIEEQDDWWECEHDHRVNHGDGFCNWSEEKKNEDR